MYNGILFSLLAALGWASATLYESVEVYADETWRIDDVRVSGTISRMLNINKPLAAGKSYIAPENLAGLLIAQSSCSLAEPTNLGATQRLVSLELVALALHADRVSQVAVIGFGAGCLGQIINAFIPDCEVVGVESEAMVVQLAQRFFHIDSTRVTIQDGVLWLMETTRKFDILFVDAYDGPAIPPHFLSEQFLNRLPFALRENGIMVANYCTERDVCAIVNPPVSVYVRGLRQAGFEEVLILDDTIGSIVIIALLKAQHIGKKLLFERLDGWRDSIAPRAKARDFQNMMLLLAEFDSVTD